MKKLICSALALLGLIAACDAKTSDAASCVQGWWLAQSNACSACGGENANPECAQADCEQFASQGFTRDATVFDAVITYSKTAGTVSTVGPGVWRHFTASNGRISLAGSLGGSLTCSSAQLKGSYSSQTRASSSIADALARATATQAASFRGVRTGS